MADSDVENMDFESEDRVEQKRENQTESEYLAYVESMRQEKLRKIEEDRMKSHEIKVQLNKASRADAEPSPRKSDDKEPEWVAKRKSVTVAPVGKIEKEIVTKEERDVTAPWAKDLRLKKSTTKEPAPLVQAPSTQQEPKAQIIAKGVASGGENPWGVQLKKNRPGEAEEPKPTKTEPVPEFVQKSLARKSVKFDKATMESIQTGGTSNPSSARSAEPTSARSKADEDAEIERMVREEMEREEADRAKLREEEKRKAEEEDRLIREELEREEAELKQKEDERKAREAEAKRKAEEAEEAERQQKAEQEAREAEEKRKADEEEANKRKAEEAREAEEKLKAEQQAEADREAREAEEKRKADEAEAQKRADEEAREAEEKRKADEAERQRAEEQRQAEEAARQQQAEREAREAEEKRKADEEEANKLKAEEARQAEERRKSEEVERAHATAAPKELAAVDAATFAAALRRVQDLEAWVEKSQGTLVTLENDNKALKENLSQVTSSNEKLTTQIADLQKILDGL